MPAACSLFGASPGEELYRTDNAIIVSEGPLGQEVHTRLTPQEDDDGAADVRAGGDAAAAIDSPADNNNERSPGGAGVAGSNGPASGDPRIHGRGNGGGGGGVGEPGVTAGRGPGRGGMAPAAKDAQADASTSVSEADYTVELVRHRPHTFGRQAAFSAC